MFLPSVIILLKVLQCCVNKDSGSCWSDVTWSNHLLNPFCNPSIAACMEKGGHQNTECIGSTIIGIPANHIVNYNNSIIVGRAYNSLGSFLLQKSFNLLKVLCSNLVLSFFFFFCYCSDKIDWYQHHYMSSWQYENTRIVNTMSLVITERKPKVVAE